MLIKMTGPSLAVLALAVFNVITLIPAETLTVCGAVSDRGEVVADTTRTYRFKARIKHNANVTPFKVGELITGTFSYDVQGKNVSPGAYESARNAFSFQIGDLYFSGAGKVRVTVGNFEIAEHLKHYFVTFF